MVKSHFLKINCIRIQHNRALQKKIAADSQIKKTIFADFIAKAILDFWLKICQNLHSAKNLRICG